MATLSRHGAGATVCLTGPESSGKTTLAGLLSERFGAHLVEEVAREFLAGRESYSSEDLLEITRLQLDAETRARAEEGLVLLDTDVVVLAIWWLEKFGPLPPLLNDALETRSPRVYLLLEPDLPWTPDPLRENPIDRQRLFERQRALLEETGSTYRVVSGAGEARLESAWMALQQLLA